MAIQVVSEPDILAFSGNPIVFKLTSNVGADPTNGLGSYFDGYLDDFKLCRKAGTKLIFEFNNQRVEFTVNPHLKNEGELGSILPSRQSNYQGDFIGGKSSFIPFTPDLNTPASRWDGVSGKYWPLIPLALLVPYLKANYTLNAHYEIEQVGDKIRFIARERGSNHSLQFSGSNGNKSEFLVVDKAGINPRALEFKKVLVDIFFKLSGSPYFEKIYSEEIWQDPLFGTIELDIAPVLSVYLRHDLPSSSAHTDSKGTYFCRFTELIGPKKTVGAWIETPKKHVLKGGLSRLAFKTKKLLDILQPVPADLSKNRFLKQGSRIINIREGQPECLTYFNTLPSETMFILKVHVHYGNGGKGTATLELNQPIKQYEKILIPCGLETLRRVTNNDPQPIKSYSVYLCTRKRAIVSEEVTYQIDTTFRENVRYFVYWSSFGSLDTLVTYGRGEEFYDLNTQTASKRLGNSAPIEVSNRENYHLKIQRNFKVTTGWLTKNQFDQLTDFFLAEKKWIVAEGAYLPITVTSKKLGEYQDQNPLIAQVFEYQYDFDESKYTAFNTLI